MSEENNKKRILIVEDEANIQELLKLNLEANGYKIAQAFNGKEALEMCLAEKPDLIILDIIMPEVDGWEVCKAIRDNDETKNIKILMLTSKGQERDRIIGKEIFKADEYIAKPFEMGNIILKVEELLYGK